MSRYLYTRGRPTLAVGICQRSGFKVPLDQLVEDPNVPGLMVRRKDCDEYDPYRLSPPAAEDITLRNPRPDVKLRPDPADQAYPDDVL